MPEASFDQLRDLDILFLDALRHKPHPTHSTVENSLRIVERVKPRRAFFTQSVTICRMKRPTHHCRRMCDFHTMG